MTAEYEPSDHSTDRHPRAEEFTPQPGEEIVRITEQEGYTEVVKREPCGNDCNECPHGPYVYHVREETTPDGSTRLHWSFIGPVADCADDA